MGGLYHASSGVPDGILAGMLLIGIEIILGLAVGIVLAFAIAGAVRENLEGARKHGNTVLPFLHIAWIASIAFFGLHGFTLF